MKSIEDTLSFLKTILSGLDDVNPTAFALVGGYAGIAHGIPRTTTDVDLAVFSETVRSGGIRALASRLKAVLPPEFTVQLHKIPARKPRACFEKPSAGTSSSADRP